MIDISDGLASEVFHICTSSNVGCQLYEEKIPIDPQTYQTSMYLNITPRFSQIFGGEFFYLF
jgi:thiamine-monophosphate kinase